MAKHPWLAFFFDCVDESQPPVRMEVVEADSEDEAGKLAAAHLGSCQRVAIARPVWIPPGAALMTREATSARRASAPLCE